MTSDDGRNGLTRRSLLGVGGASVLGAVTGTAGCLSAMPPLGQSVKYGRLDVPAAGPPGYREWLPDPELVGQERETVQVQQVQPSAWVDAQPRPFAFHSVIVSQLDYLGIGYGTYDQAIWYGDEVVVLASFDPESVAETLLDSGFDRATSTDRYHLFERSDRDRAVAVGSGFVINSWASQPERNVDAILDAKAGDVPRFHEVDEEFARLSENAGDRLWTWRLGTSGGDQFAGEVVDNVASSTADDRVYLVTQYLFTEGTTPSKSAIKRVLEEDMRATTSQQTDIEIDGRVVTVEYHDPEEEYRVEGDDPLSGLPPQVTWGFDYEPGALRVTIRHEAGDEFDPETVTVHVDGDPADDQFADRFDTVGPGDKLVVGFESESKLPEYGVSIIWERPDGDVTSMLADYEVAEER